jgi:DNA recombination protein RmuC
MDTLLLGVLILLVVILLFAVMALLFRRPQGGTDLSAPLENLAQAIQQEQTQSAVLAEKLTHLEPVSQSVSSIQIELRGLSERVSKVERNQNQVSQNIFTLGTGMHTELSRAKEDLTRLQTYAKARRAVEQQTADSIRRLEAIIAGTQTKGTAGENILEVVFARLPVDWQVRNFRVGDRAVEFGLRLPNNLILPIDSKWAATHLLEQFMACDAPAEQQKLKAQIERVVLGKAKEVRKYIDPNVTVNFAVAAVPDAIYDLCSGIQIDAFRLNVVLVSYSMFVPYLLLVFQTILKTAQNIDLQKLDMYLQNAQDGIEALQKELEGRFSRAITMLNNSRNDMSVHLSKISSGLTSLQIGASPPPAIAELGGPKSIGGV